MTSMALVGAGHGRRAAMTSMALVILCEDHSRPYAAILLPVSVRAVRDWLDDGDDDWAKVTVSDLPVLFCDEEHEHAR